MRAEPETTRFLYKVLAIDAANGITNASLKRLVRLFSTAMKIREGTATSGEQASISDKGIEAIKAIGLATLGVILTSRMAPMGNDPRDGQAWSSVEKSLLNEADHLETCSGCGFACLYCGMAVESDGMETTMGDFHRECSDHDSFGKLHEHLNEIVANGGSWTLFADF
jgi:hypothetical protein